MTRECLECKKEFEAKRESAKYCSDNCRVKWHQKNGKKKKEEIKPFQMQALYNQILDVVSKIGATNGLPPAVGGIIIPEKPKKQTIVRSAEQWHELKRACESAEEWAKVKEQIENAQNLTTKQKQIIINTP